MPEFWVKAAILVSADDEQAARETVDRALRSESIMRSGTMGEDGILMWDRTGNAEEETK
jgi:hypothetical protein